MVVDERGSVMQHNEAALRLLGVEVLSFESQVKKQLASDNFSRRDTTALLNGKKVRIIAFSDIRSELSSRELESWTKLIRVLTHEIMNNVAPITSLSETLSHKAGDEEVKEGLAVINSTGKQLLNFIDSYRRMTLMPQPQPKLFYVKPFLERMAAICSEYSKDASFHISTADDALLLYADESLVAHVVTNLLKNAKEAVACAQDEEGSGDSSSQRDSKVWIEAYTGDDDSVVIDICDDAALIAPDVAQQVFVPFFTTKQGGSGIGLPLSRQIMRVSGGTLELLQDAKARKTVFRMKI